MGASNTDGPKYSYGNLSNLPASVGGSPVSDPNQDASPDGVFQGLAIFDVRYWFQKDRVQGFTGVVPLHMTLPTLRSAQQIPAALASNNIAAAQGATSGTAMTLASATVGVALNIPIVPAGAQINGAAPVTAAIALDFGFAWANCTAGNVTVTVSNNADYIVGMPLVIGGVGNSGGTIPLLCNVASIVAGGTTQITLNVAPSATNSAAPIGTGNIWGPSETWYNLANQLPTAALPWLGAGPGLFLDPRQTIARGVQIAGSSLGAGGTFTVRGWDVFNTPMSETITVGAGAVTGWGKKAFKYIGSVTPNFTDASHNYTVGTSDVFGLHYRAPIWDDIDVTWNNTYMSGSTGYTAPLALGTASTATTADVRGTVQTSTNGGGSGIGATASNGTVSGLAMSGVRLTASQVISVTSSLLATQANPQYLFGMAQA